MAKPTFTDQYNETRDGPVDAFIVDTDLLSTLEGMTWYLDAYGYLVRTLPDGKPQCLHHYVWEHHNQGKAFPSERYLDHLNKNLRDNRYENLLVVDSSEKMANNPVRRDSSTGLKGVQASPNGRFRGSVGHEYKRRNVGSYATDVEAAYAVNVGFEFFYPRLPTPNLLPDDALSESLKDAVRANVYRLLRPDREPGQP